MRGNRQFVINLLMFLICLFGSVPIMTAFGGQAPGAAGSTKSTAGEERMLQPSDLFPGFPEIKWGMNFQEAKNAIEKTGSNPVGFGSAKTELTWDGVFNNLNGRATVLFKEDAGVYEIAVIVYAFDKRKEVFERWAKKIIERHGAAKEADNSISLSKLWMLKNGFAIELRLIKDDDSPVVDVHWVRS